MDQFDYSDEALQPTRDSAAIIWNILTVVVLLIAMCVCVGVVAILVNPYVSINPFPPPTLPVKVELPTVTPTPRSVLPATWTPTVTTLPTLTPTRTNTPVPTATQLPDTLTPAVETPSQTNGPTATQVADTETPTPTEGMPFILHPGDPVAIANIGYPELGCDWMGVAGQAFDLSLAPIEEGLFVQLGGILGDELVEMLDMVGRVDTYGPGSYEFVLGDEPIESSQTLWVQLFDQAMLPLSEQISFDTYADCDKNLILIHFNQTR
jgi:hypothetical protein